MLATRMQRPRVWAHRARHSRWLLPIALLLLAAAIWTVGRSGLVVRERLWETTRSVRWHGDIANAFRWGGRVLQVAREDSGVTVPTVGDIVRAEGRVYRDLVEQRDSNDYRLDYPPGRLLIVSLWRRHVAQIYPMLRDWPGPLDVGRRQRAGGATEEIAAPLLALNTACGAASAVLAGLLVGVWVWRGMPRSRRPDGSGVLAFVVCFAGLFVGLLTAVWPCPAPPPSVRIDGPPTVVPGGAGTATAIVHATIDPRGKAAQWSVQWGTRPGVYDATQAGPPVDGVGPTAVMLNLPGLPAGQAIYYRVTARNDTPSDAADQPGRGIMRTDEATFVAADVVQPRQPAETSGAVWPDVGQWVGIGVMMLGVCWSIRRMSRPYRALASGLLAGVSVWLNPALLVDAHAWPQWESWLLPPLLAAALLASLDCWLVAGMVMGVGMMFKGQFLIGVGVLAVWPLAAGRVGAVSRLVVGMALMAGLLLSPWIVLAGRPPSWASVPMGWIGGVMLAAGLGVLLSLGRRRVAHAIILAWDRMRRRRNPDSESISHENAIGSGIGMWRVAAVIAITFAVLAVIVLVLRRWSPEVLPRGIGWAFVGLLLAVPWVLPRRSLGVWTAAILAAAIWLSSGLFDGDYSWKAVGFEYGAAKFDIVASGQGAMGNLPSILNRRFGWDLHDPALDLRLPNVASLLYAGRAPADVPRWIGDWSLDGRTLTLDLKQTMILIYGGLLTLCGIAAAYHARHRDPRVLAAVVAPWLLMPTLLCQMMCRYYTWGATLAALLIAVAPELLVLNGIVATLAAGMIFKQMMDYDGQAARAPLAHTIVGRLAPESGWVMLAAATVVLIIALTPGRRQGSGKSLKS